MKCHYCQRECVKYEQIIADSPSTRTIRHECEPCGANFRLLIEDGNLFSITWKDIEINDHKYYVKLYSGVTGNAPETVIYWYATNSEGKQYWEEVQRLDFVPQDWTPQNVTDKLKTLLPFL